MTLHAGAWLCWYVSALIVASSSVHPFVSVGTILAAATVVIALTPTSDRGPFKVIMALGTLFLVARVILFTATGRTGSTTLFTLPELALPDLFGGVRFGGAISAEVLFNEVSEGLRLVAILAATGAFVSVTDVAALVRMAPRRFRGAGIVIQIGVAFLPSLAASVREVREAQKMRGLKAKGLRSAVPLIMPVLTAALDRAFALAESLHARGFERPTPSRFRSTKFSRRSVLLVTLSIAAIGSAYMLSGSAAHWSPYPRLAVPPLQVGLLIAPFLLMSAAFAADQPEAQVVA
jgi:energy-coupling factor transport system permease protein